VTPAQEELLRRLSLNDESVTARALLGGSGMTGLLGMDAKTSALARLAALIASDACTASYQWAVDASIARGATEEDIVDVLLAIAPIVGLARVTSAAPELALALGFDVVTSDANSSDVS